MQVKEPPTKVVPVPSSRRVTAEPLSAPSPEEFEETSTEAEPQASASAEPAREPAPPAVSTPAVPTVAVQAPAEPIRDAAPSTPVVSPRPQENPVVQQAPAPVPVAAPAANQQYVPTHRSASTVVPKVVVQHTIRNSGRVTKTDLVTPDGRGVFDDFTTNMSKIRYEKGVTYNDLLPLNFTRGFNTALESVAAQLTNRQNEDLLKLTNYLSREIKEYENSELKLVRVNSASLLRRSLQDFFIANAPRDCFDGVAGEQDARRVLGLKPLPELEIYERAAELHDPTQGPMNPHIVETDLEVRGGGGVFDDYPSNLSMFRFEKGVSYNDLLPLHFTAGFNSGLVRSTFQVTLHQLEEGKKFSNYLSREIKSSRASTRAGIRANSVSMLSRIMLDFFIAYAPADCFDGVSGEQHLRSNLGLPPLPELAIFEHEMAKILGRQS